MNEADIYAMGGLAQAALQVAGNITASTFNYEHTKELAKWQNDMNVQNWRMQNEYNLPENQIKRLEAAGLNPNLMYGQGNPGNAGSISSASAPGHNEVRNPFEGVQLMSAFQEAKSLALDNEMKSMRNQEELNKLYESEMRNNALRVFVRDKTLGTQEFGSFVFPDSYRWRNNKNLVDFDHLRHTPMYQQLEQLWQRGIINDKNIGLIGEKTGLLEKQSNVLEFNEQRNQLLADIMKGGVSDGNLSKLITLLLLNLLTSGSSGSLGKFW